jgi:metal-dependent hydrolase (beta-lactamase superfamily II)
VTPLPEVERIASILEESLKLKRVAPGHCTSERDRSDQAGVGSVIKLP